MEFEVNIKVKILIYYVLLPYIAQINLPLTILSY